MYALLYTISYKSRRQLARGTNKLDVFIVARLSEAGAAIGHMVRGRAVADISSVVVARGEGESILLSVIRKVSGSKFSPVCSWVLP